MLVINLNFFQNIYCLYLENRAVGSIWGHNVNSKVSYHITMIIFTL